MLRLACLLLSARSVTPQHTCVNIDCSEIFGGLPAAHVQLDPRPSC